MKKLCIILCFLAAVTGVLSFTLVSYASIFYVRLACLFMLAAAAIIFITNRRHQKSCITSGGNDMNSNLVSFDTSHQ